MNKRNIKILSDREHIYLKTEMVAGAVSLTEIEGFDYENNQIIWKKKQIVPALIKMIDEIIDNSVDAHLKQPVSDTIDISVKITGDMVQIKDSGSGIDTSKNEAGIPFPRICWGMARAGSNFEGENIGIGTFGYGSFITNVLSKKFIGETDDGKNKYKVTFSNNAEKFTEKYSESKTRGTTVEFEPDLQRFGLSEINETHKNVIFQRLQCLAIAYPEINFKYNGKSINFKSFKNFASLFGSGYEVYENGNIKIAVIPNDTDDFKQFSYVNGLKISDGGTHIDAISGEIVSQIREKLQRKYKNIKPGDIKNKLTLVVFVSGFPNAKFNSQTKEKLTNPAKEFNDFAKIDYSFVNKILKNQDIINPIVEIYKIKQEFEDRKALKSVTTKKKLKSEKYFRATGEPKYLCICEGFSAYGGISPVLGNSDISYYCLRGKPLNSWEISNQKMVQNREMGELYKILNEEQFKYVLTTTDQDLDSFSIIALLCGFIEKFAPQYKERFGRLNTPIKIAFKDNIPVRWVYDFNTVFEPRGGEVVKYFKGLGSHSREHLEYIIKKEGFENVVEKFNFDDYKIMNEFLATDESDARKDYIRNNNFSIAKV